MKFKKLNKLRNRFCRLRHTQDLAKLLEVPAYKLQLIAQQPKYHIFSIPKKDGSKRWIEDPETRLKKIQRPLNKYLQACYFFARTEAAYGFLINPKKDPEPRNILTNAQKHLGATWLMNLDIEDFFHQVKAKTVATIFTASPFEFNIELTEVLVGLMTHQGRLPMGAPTSPVLSNFATREMDEQLLALAKWGGWTYTRFADDMSFSSLTPLDDTSMGKVSQIIDDYGFQFNKEKIRLFKPGDLKEVTGLIIGEKEVTIPTVFLTSLEKDLEKLQQLKQVQQRFNKASKWVDKFEEQMHGSVTFINFIMGEDNPVSEKFSNKLEQSLYPVEDFEQVSWDDFPYWSQSV